MPATTDLPHQYAVTRADLQRVATHVLGRSRAAHGGHFGLRVTPTGIATPPFGADDTVVRVAGTDLVVERQTSEGVTARILALPGTSLAGAAAFRRDLTRRSLRTRADAPPVGEPDAPLALDAASRRHRPQVVPDGGPASSTPCSPTSTGRLARSCGPNTSTWDCRPRRRPEG